MDEPEAVILVEGESDRAALETLAERRGRDLDAERVSIVAMGGASPIGAHLIELSARGIRLAGLCDEQEERDFRRGLERAGLGTALSRSQMEELGFFVCVADLEDELIRSLGDERVQEILEEQGELRGFRVFQNQPEWRGRGLREQLRRFIGVKAGRKRRYGALLVDALDLGRVPRPLERVLAHV